MKNKIISFLIFFCYAYLSFGGIKKNVEKVKAINSIYDNHTFLLSEKLILLTSKNNIETSFDALSIHVFTPQIKLIPTLQILNYPLWFQTEAIANLLEIQAYQYFTGNHFYSAKAKYKQAYQESLKTKNINQQIAILRNLVLLNYLENNYIDAFIYNNLLLEKLKVLPKNQHLLLKTIILNAKITLAQGSFKQAEDLIYKNALPISSGLANKNLLFDSFLTLSQIYLKTKSYTQSKWFAIQALDLAQKKGLRNKQITALIVLAKVKSVTGDYILAQQNLENAKLLCAESSIYLTDIYQTQYLNYKRMGNLNTAQAYLVKFLALKKSLIN